MHVLYVFVFYTLTKYLIKKKESRKYYNLYNLMFCSLVGEKGLSIGTIILEIKNKVNKNC